ncbi:MAG: hypothetical protein ACYTFY_06640 [Planctomycetota bacterium]
MGKVVFILFVVFVAGCTNEISKKTAQKIALRDVDNNYKRSMPRIFVPRIGEIHKTVKTAYGWEIMVEVTACSTVPKLPTFYHVVELDKKGAVLKRKSISVRNHTQGNTIIKIAIDSNGNYYLNEKKITLEEFEEILKDKKDKPKTFFRYVFMGKVKSELKSEYAKKLHEVCSKYKVKIIMGSSIINYGS